MALSLAERTFRSPLRLNAALAALAEEGWRATGDGLQRGDEPGAERIFVAIDLPRCGSNLANWAYACDVYVSRSRWAATHYEHHPASGHYACGEGEEWSLAQADEAGCALAAALLPLLLSEENWS